MFKNIGATIDIFGDKPGDDTLDKEFEARKKKIEEHFESLDPKKRQWEKKKMEHYRITGKEYLLPGEKPRKPKLAKVSAETMKVDPKHVFANGQLKMLSIQ